MMNEMEITIVLMLPRRIRNCFWFSFIEDDEMIAACDAPSPGRKEAIGEIRVVAIVGLMSSFLSKISFPIFCLGGVIFLWME